MRSVGRALATADGIGYRVGPGGSESQSWTTWMNGTPSWFSSGLNGDPDIGAGYRAAHFFASAEGRLRENGEDAGTRTQNLVDVNDAR